MRSVSLAPAEPDAESSQTELKSLSAKLIVCHVEKRKLADQLQNKEEELEVCDTLFRGEGGGAHRHVCDFVQIEDAAVPGLKNRM